MKRKTLGLVGGVLTFASLYAASSAPIPMYSYYTRLLRLGNSDLSLSSVIYFAGTVVALLIFSRLSDAFGRRPIISLTIILAIIGLALFYSVSNPTIFLLGRLFQGLSCGLGSSCVAAYIVDLTSLSRASTLTSTSPMLGLAIGSMGSGFLTQLNIMSVKNVYLILMAMLLICFILLVFSPETVQIKRIVLADMLPKFSVPKSVHLLLVPASAVFIATWSIGGFYQSFSSTLSKDYLHTGNVLVAATVFTCLQSPNIVGASLSTKYASRQGQFWGMLGFIVSLLAAYFSLIWGYLFLFLLSTVFLGIFWGLSYTSSVQSILGEVSSQERAGVLSSIYAISYSGAGIPNLIVGRISHYFSLIQIFGGYLGLVFLMFVVIILFRGGNHYGYSNDY